MQAHFILYVKNQQQSTDFYHRVLDIKPRLNVPGMTEFELNNGSILGLMPEQGIKNLLGDAITHPKADKPIARSELYLVVQNPLAFHLRAIENGAVELSGLSRRNWGPMVAYSQDLDGYILAFSDT